MRTVLLLLALLVLPALVSVPGLEVRPTQAGPPFNCNNVHIHPGSLSNGQVSVPYFDSLWLTPANVALPVIVTNVTGTLPPGLAFGPGNPANYVDLTGTPTANGTFTFTVELGGTYVLGTICKDSFTYTVTIAP